MLVSFLYSCGCWRKLDTLLFLAADDALGTGILGSLLSCGYGICRVFLGCSRGPVFSAVNILQALSVLFRTDYLLGELVPSGYLKHQFLLQMLASTYQYLL